MTPSTRSPALLLAVMAVLAAAGVPAAAQGWEWQNPSPHGLAINDIVMADEYRAAAVCANGYFMRSFDGGVTWETRNLWHSNLLAVANPSGSTLVVLGLDGLILRSTNFGWAWDTLAQDVQLENTVVPRLDVGDDGTMLAQYGDSHLAVSRDDGATWQTLPFPHEVGGVFGTIAIQARDVWLLSNNRTVYRSSDGGQTWRADSSYKTAGLQKLVFIDSLYGYQLRGGQVLRTRDGGVTWVEMNVYGFSTFIGLAAGPNLGRTVYCLATTDYLVNKSTDQGETWNISLGGTAFPDAYPAAISFANERIGLVAGEGGRILRTENGGASWSIVHGLGFIGAITNAAFSDPSNGIACTGSHAVLVTSNGGRRWDEVLPHPDFFFLYLSMLDGGDAYAIAQNEHYEYAVFHSPDRGRNWTQRSLLSIMSGMWGPWPNSILAVSRDTLWVGASEGVAYRSVDGGVHWDSLTVSPMLRYDDYSGQSMYAFPPSTVLYLSPYGLGVSQDAGTTWTFRPASGGMNALWAMQFLTKDVGFALGQYSTVKTTDGGVHWERQGDAPDFELYHVFDERRAVGFGQSILHAEAARIWETSDGGVSWIEHSLRERVQWYGWCWTSPGEGWVFGPGGMLRHTDNGGVAFAECAAPLPAGIELDVYPSPYRPSAGGALSLRFTIPGGEALPVRLEIWSALGQKVACVLEGVHAPGEHFTTFRPQAGSPQLPAGVYVCRLSAGVLQQSRAFVVVR